MEVRSQRERVGTGDVSSPELVKMCSNRLKQKVKPPTATAASRRVQVVYYLSRNGLLEHPHFMELTLLPNQPLRLKDVFDRLMALRGSGMPLQYSWSSKRNYKSGYVWHDLALKDIIHPAEGSGEYVLKGSELVQCSATESFQLLRVGNKKQAIHQLPEYEEEDYEDHHHQGKVYEELGEKTSSYTNTNTNTSSTTTPHSRCSRGVSTEELVDNNELQVMINKTSSKNSKTLAEKLQNQQGWVHTRNNNNNPKRLVGGEDSLTESTRSRHSSVLLQLIACGSSALELNKAKHEPRVSNVGTTTTTRNKGFSEDRRLEQYCCEEKEYFSGSIVESMKALEAEAVVLNRSNSYDEQRRRRSRLGMEGDEEKKFEVMEEDKSSKIKVVGVKERCIPCNN